jgi:rhodanese-related sulfurtransferase
LNSAPDLKALSPLNVMDLIISGEELALIDLREEGTFGEGHLLFAVSLPLSRLEHLIDDLVPRLDVPIILCVGGRVDFDLMLVGAERLRHFGYKDISYLDGGLSAWAEAGYEVFSGVNVPSKAFGEVIEIRFATPHIKAAELQAMKDREEDFVIVDSRPMSEFTAMSIPGGIDVPGAELVLRIHDIAPDPKTTVVVNCAGRTRSIIGAQSLINAGIPNRVVALENGTMGWHLAGYNLDTGQLKSFSPLSDAGLIRADEYAGRVADRFGVVEIDTSELNQWRVDKTRTLYVLDVRASTEFNIGHLSDAKSAPGGQLVQATDQFVGVRGARLVLVDDNGVRARMTASWLVQMGWKDVYVLSDGISGETLISGPYQPKILGLEEASSQTIESKELATLMLEKNVYIIDLANSRHYRNGHIPTSHFSLRRKLADNIAKIPDTSRIVLTSPEGISARLAAMETSGRDVLVLAGGSIAWEKAGLPLATGFKDSLDDPIDVWYRPYDLEEGNEEAMQSYLSWEVDLTEQIERDGTTNFPEFSL